MFRIWNKIGFPDFHSHLFVPSVLVLGPCIPLILLLSLLLPTMARPINEDEDEDDNDDDDESVLDPKTSSWSIKYAAMMTVQQTSKHAYMRNLRPEEGGKAGNAMIDRNSW